MEKPMERRVEGTYRTANEAKEAVQRLLEEGYQRDELLLIIEDDSNHGKDLRTLTQVDVDLVDVDEDDSFWDRIVEAFTFTEDDEDDEASSLEEYGVREGNAERFNEALEADEIVLLVDSRAPRNNGTLSEVNENVLKTEGGVKQMTNADKNKNQNIDEVGSEEAAAIKNEGSQEVKGAKPSDVSTSETSTEAMGNTNDASQAENTRDEEDIHNDQGGSSKEGNFNAETTEDEGTSLETTPELTGDEETVKKDPSDEHRYQDNIAKGTVDGKGNDK